jgi:capsule polysaccharide modification protein KpsS
MADLTGRHLLLLQGPAGPFFARVARQLRAAGAQVSKVNFNSGEDLYYGGRDVHRYRGTLADWPTAFEELARRLGVDGILLFGDCRPLHKAAIARARELGIEVFVFEEGYLRPDFVTFERNGVNGHSSIPRDPRYFAEQPLPEEPSAQKVEHAFLKSALHTICYAVTTALLKYRYPHYRHHRDIRPLVQCRLWVRSGLRRTLHLLRDRHVAARIAARSMPPYFLVPLQVCLDSQLQHSHYKTINEFIREVVASFAKHAPSDNVLILKLHPMDRAYSDYSAEVDALRREHGLHDRLFYVDVINLPAALRGARGTVVINSTVGLSSITHGTPAKCMGQAIYDVPGLTHQGSLEEFWRAPGSVDRQLQQLFRVWLIQNNQLNGSVWSRLYDDPSRLIGSKTRG